MSNKLLELVKFDNIRLYPVADEETIESLYQQCDIYLDNNKGNELDAVSRAFENDMVIFATMMKHIIVCLQPLKILL